MREILENVIAGLPGDLIPGLLEEFKTGWRKEAVEAETRRTEIGRATRGRNYKAVEGLGQLEMRIDPTSFHYWGNRLGYGCWRDEQFIREYKRDNPECVVKSTGTKMQMGYTGNKRSSKKYNL